MLEALWCDEHQSPSRWTNDISHHLFQMWHPWKLLHYDHMQAWIGIALVCLEWMGLEFHLFFQLLEDKIRALNDAKPKTKLKWMAFCVTANSFSYVFYLNTQCLVVRWSHPLSWLLRFSHVPTKLFCACHKFVWQSALNSIESKCYLSKIVKFWVHTMTCELMIQDLVFHLLVHHFFTIKHTPQCTIAWLKRWPNILVWFILHGLGHYNDHWDYRHNHIYKKHLW